MRGRYISKIKKIAEEEFGIDELSTNCRKRIYINARAWYFKACRSIEETNISHTAAAEHINRDHATSIHAIQEYPMYKRYDGFSEYHLLADRKLAIFVGKQNPYDPVKWRDRKIERIKALYRKKPTKDQILAEVLDRVGVSYSNKKTSRAEIEDAIKGL